MGKENTSHECLFIFTHQWLFEENNDGKSAFPKKEKGKSNHGNLEFSHGGNHSKPTMECLWLVLFSRKW